MKVDVVTLQEVHKVFSTYFTIVEHAHKISESNKFGGFVFNVCTLASDKVGNTVLLNHSNNCLLCQTGWNVHTMIKYLGGISNQL